MQSGEHTPIGYDVVSLPRLSQGAKWRTEAMRSYSRPVLIWFTKGQGRIAISGIKRGYGSHNAIFLPAGTMHGFDILGQVLGSVVFFPNDLRLGLPADVIHLRIRDVRRQAEMNSFIDQLQNEMIRKDPESGTAMDLISGLLGVWLRRQEELRDPDVAERSAASRLVAAYASLLERDFRSHKSVSDYARELGVTATHLSRVCNQTMGRPASGILADRVYTEARRMLRSTTMPVKDIAARLGFKSAAYFTRSFSRCVGRTPSDFRRTGADIPA